MTFVENAKHKYDSIQHSSDIAFIINNQASKLTSIFNAAIYKAEPAAEDPEKWSFISDFLPGVVVGFGAEGAGIEVYYDYYYLYEKAIITPENDDNLFFEAYSNNIEIRDKTNSGNKHLIKFKPLDCSDFETCYSLIGKGLFLEIFRKIQKALNEETNFEKNLTDLKYGLFSNIHNTSYAYSKKQVLEYFDKIATEITFTDSKKIKLTEFRGKIEKMPASNFNYLNR